MGGAIAACRRGAIVPNTNEGLSRISSGITITVVAIVAAVICSLLFPVADDTDKE